MPETMLVHVTMIRGSATTKHRRSRLAGVNTGFFAAIVVLASWPAVAADQVHDEIQVYNAQIAGVGQWTFQQHLNYAAIGQAQPEVPGGFASNHSLQGTPEFAYGIAERWEAGFYMPFAARFIAPGLARQGWRRNRVSRCRVFRSLGAVRFQRLRIAAGDGAT
jgi:hypothetical protein